MKITVFGASGKTGLLLVYQALEKGHQVIAFARTPSSVTIHHKNLEIVQGDVLDYDRVKHAILNTDVVLSTIGTRSRKDGTTVSAGTRNIIRAMEECGVKRFICMSTAGILGNDGGFFFGRILVPLLLRKVMADKIRQYDLIRASSLDWVVIRPSYLTDSPKTGRYRITPGNPASSSVPRADVADFMLKLLTDKQYDRQSPAVASHPK